MTPTMSSLLNGMTRPSLVPDLESIRAGMERRLYGKDPVKVTKYMVDVFDMSDPSRRKEYSDLMLKLFPMVQDAQVVLCKNELQVLTGPSGTGWWRYVEWFEYALNESSTTTVVDQAGGNENKPDAPGNGDGDEEDDF